MLANLFHTRAKNFEKSGDYNKTWKASEDGQVNTNGPRVIVDAGNGVGPTGGFITRYEQCIISGKSSHINISLISPQNIYCGYSLEAPQ